MKTRDVPTLTLAKKNGKGLCSADLYLSHDHCWYVWEKTGCGGENDATRRNQSIEEAMREAEHAVVRYLEAN